MPVHHIIHPIFRKVQVQEAIIFTQKVFILFFIWSILGTPFPTYGLPGPFEFTSPFFESFAKGTSTLFGWNKTVSDTRFFSDSLAMYVHCLNGVVIAWLMAAIWHIRFGKKAVKKTWYFVMTAVRYFLALQLFTYAFTKIFQWQFNVPEPNILFTPAGQLHKDTLLWTTIGASESYQLITGSIEFIAGAFLLFKNTTKAGALLAVMIFAQVLLLNLGFNISVKLFSMHLLLFSGIVWLSEKYTYMITPDEPPYVPLFKFVHRAKYNAVKTILIVLLVANALWPYCAAGNFNDRESARPYFHGAYNVEKFTYNNEELPPLLSDKKRWRRIAVHRAGFFLVQDMNDEWHDYQMLCDTINKKVEVYNAINGALEGIFQYRSTSSHHFTTLKGTLNGNLIEADMNYINLTKLPLLQKEFTWISN